MLVFYWGGSRVRNSLVQGGISVTAVGTESSPIIVSPTSGRCSQAQQEDWLNRKSRNDAR